MTATSVSIVTPVLNRVDTIEACLRSVSEQSYPNIEHIIVDGGSTDGTLDVIASFRGRQNLSCISGRDEGMYDAINKGFEISSGKIMAYLNSDDVYLPYSIEVAAGTLQSAEMIYGDLGILVDKESPIFYPQFYPPFDLRFYTYWHTLGQPTVFWRRELWERVGRFDTSYKLLGDCEYWLRASTSGISPLHVPEILAVQVEHEGTLRATQEERLRREFTRLRSQYASAAGRPGSAFLEHVRRSLRWRVYQIKFLRAMHAPSGRRWGRFGAFLREREVQVRSTSALRHLLPESLRPSDASTLDAAALRHSLLQS